MASGVNRYPGPWFVEIVFGSQATPRVERRQYETLEGASADGAALRSRPDAWHGRMWREGERCVVFRLGDVDKPWPDGEWPPVDPDGGRRRWGLRRP